MKSLTVANTTGRKIATRNLEIKHESVSSDSKLFHDVALTIRDRIACGFI